MAPTVFRVAHQAVALAAIRLGLAAAGFAAALAVGAGGAPAGVAVAFGAAVTGAALASDRRSLVSRRPSVASLPPNAVHAGLPRAILMGLLPSTIGVGILVAVSLSFEPVLAAALAGVLAGMGVIGTIGLVELVVSERSEHEQLLADAHDTTRRYARPR